MKLVIFILSILLEVLACILFYLYGKKNKINEYEQKINSLKSKSDIRVAHTIAIIRFKRNALMKHQTILKTIPQNEQKFYIRDYIGVRANIELLKELEETIENEV